MSSRADLRGVSHLALAWALGLSACSGGSSHTAPEACNHLDDNGNGQTDETFTDDAGLYSTLANCGHCGVDCHAAFPTAAEVACEASAPGAHGFRCVLTACPPGTHETGGVACLPDVDVSCQPCHDDTDCAAAGDSARCVVFGPDDARCAMPCGGAAPEAPDAGFADAGFADAGSTDAGAAPDAGRPAAPCAPGLTCQARQGISLCLPVSGRCDCTPEHAGETTPCFVESPSGRTRCQGSQTCDGASVGACVLTAVEVCDGADNDCDDLIDEDFLTDGQYLTAENCGACDRPCVTGAPNMVATCVADPADNTRAPRCEIACLDNFVDLDGAQLNGCECEQVASSWPPGAHGVDGDCDGRVDISADYIYVSKRGDDANRGSLDAPVRTITRGLQLGASRHQPVFVGEGRYDEAVALQPGVSLFGGYRNDFGARDLSVFPVIIEHDSGPAGAPVLTAVGIDLDTQIGGLTLVGTDAREAGAGSTTVVLDHDGPQLVLTDVTIQAGAGADGADGASSSEVLTERGVPSLDALDGTDGRPGSGGVASIDNYCNGLSSAGGPGGDKRCPITGEDVSGGAGAGADCPDTRCRAGAQCGNAGCTDFTVGGVCDYEAMRAAAVENAPGEDGRGLGAGRGGEATFDAPTPIPNDCFCEDNPTLRREGDAGGNGTNGADGGAGTGAHDPGGRFDEITGLWTALDGTDGTDGTNGGGGGGGSEGASYDALEDNFICQDHVAGAGGGGGSAGCGAPLARGGQGGGASIGVLLRLPAGGDGPAFEHVKVLPAAAGRGGDGGIGAAGGAPGVGGDGGDGNFWCARAGGKGGDGGRGGHGGGGGGGGGGSLSGIHVVPDPADPGDAPAYVESLGLTTEVGALPAPGRGGAGGFSPGNPGTPGASGTAEAWRLVGP